MTRRVARLSVLAALVSPILLVAPAHAAGCADPRFVTSDQDGMWSSRGYVVHNNMWNVDGYAVSETLRACSYRNWSVTATADNSTGDGAVKTYPNVHQDFHDWETGAEPLLSSFRRIRSSFVTRTPRVGIYDAAYDIWLNGVPGDHEVLVWTDNFHQVPAGEVIARNRRFSGHRWKVYATKGNDYIAFVPNRRLTRETLGLKRMLHWLIDRGRLPRDVTLGQICFGFEIVSTGHRPATFTVKDFSLTTRRR
jgi:hypothetical protein